MRRGLSIAGKVVFPDGAPIADAMVQLMRDEEVVAEQPAVVKTGRDTSLTIEVPADGN